MSSNETVLHYCHAPVQFMHDLFHVHGMVDRDWFYVCLVVWFYRGPSMCKADDCNCLTARTDYLLLTTGA